MAADLRPHLPLDGVVYPTEAVVRRLATAADWVGATIGQVLEATAASHPDSPALLDDSGPITYGELERRSRHLAFGLLESGLQPGDRVLVQMGISSITAITLYALFRAGLVPVCAVPQYREFEMGALADISDATAHVIEPAAGGSSDLIALNRTLAATRPALRHLAVAGGEVPRGALDVVATSEGSDAPEARCSEVATPVDVAAFQLSGGTTGVPKVIPRFHGEYLSYARAWATRIRLTADDVVLWTLPITHNAGMILCLLPALLSRALLVLRSRFEVGDFLETVRRERVTVAGSIGPIAGRLLDDPRPAEADLASLRLFFTLNRAAEIEAQLGVTAMNIYGITEGLLMTSAPGAPAAARHQTVGVPVSPLDEVTVLEVGGTDPVPAGEVGELCFRGPSRLTAYYRNEAATSAALTADGYFRTGDLVRAQDVDGLTHFTFAGRAKDNIDRGGEKFGVEEIEEMLALHPDVTEVRIVGMPDPHLGERVCAFVMPRGDAGFPTIAELGAFLLERGVAKFKLPERVEPISEFPVTRVGKLDRAALRRRAADLVNTEPAD